MNPQSVKEKLIDKGIQPTPQRCVIAGFLFETDSHPTAEEVEAAVRVLLPGSLSRATVYNTLNLMVEKGLLDELSFEPGKIRYDALKEFHHHFVDRNTGRIIDIRPEELSEENLDMPELPERFKVRGYSITFYGDLC